MSTEHTPPIVSLIDGDGPGPRDALVVEEVLLPMLLIPAVPVVRRDVREPISILQRFLLQATVDVGVLDLREAQQATSVPLFALRRIAWEFACSGLFTADDQPGRFTPNDELCRRSLAMDRVELEKPGVLHCKPYRVALIPGDGIGKEVVPEGMRVLEAAGRKFGISFTWDEQPWSCDYYATHGRMMPEDGLSLIRHHDAIYLGAVGFPTVPDHVSLWGLLIPIRREFQLYANVRPVRLMPGVPSPLAGRKAGDIDFWVVRENNEGEYSSICGRLYGGTEHEMVMQQTIFTRRGTDRIMKYAFELAKTRLKKHVTSCTKSNGIAITMPYWDERFKAMAALFL